jgi:hypothetical protein
MPDNGQPPRRRYGLLSPFVWAGRSIVRPLAIPEIRAQAETIRGLHGVLRSRGAGSGPALVLDAECRFDLQASAEALRLQAAEALDAGRIAMEHYAQLGGVRAEELAVLLRRRRVETARATWLNLALAFFFLLLWAWSLQSAPGGFTGLLLLLSGLGVCLLFLARAVVEARTNWQIRTGRMGSLREFLLTDETWLPS